MQTTSNTRSGSVGSFVRRAVRLSLVAFALGSLGTLGGCQGVDDDSGDEDTDEIESSIVGAQVVNIDFGVSSVALPSGWNDAQALVKSGRIPLKDANNVQTTYSFKTLTPWNTTQPYGTVIASSALGLPKAATQDGVYGNVLNYGSFAAPRATMEMSGLNPSVVYNFQFFASVKKGDTFNRDTTYRIVGATTAANHMNVTNNDTHVVNLSAKPNVDGVIRIEVEKGAANNTSSGFYHLASLRMGYTLPAPGVQRLVRKDSTPFGVHPPYGYSEYLPSQYSTTSAEKWPLLIALHGIDQHGNGTTELNRLLSSWTGLPGIIKDGWFRAGDRFVVLAPQQTTTNVMTPAEVRSFLNYAKAHYNVDPKRMYLTGLSLGGRAVWDYVNAYGASTEFAAVSATPGDGAYDNPLDCTKAGRIPMWAFEGEDDPNGYTSPAHAIGGYNAINSCSTPPVEPAKLTIYLAEAHECWNKTYALTGMTSPVDPAYTKYDLDVFSWMLQHHKP